MKKKIFITIAALLLVVGVSVTAYSSSTYYNEDDINAEVNGEIISSEDVNQYIEVQELLNEYMPSEDSFASLDKETVLEELVEIKVIEAKTEQLEIELSDQEIKDIEDSLEYTFDVLYEGLEDDNENNRLTAERTLALVDEIISIYGFDSVEEYKQVAVEDMIRAEKRQILIDEYYDGDESKLEKSIRTDVNRAIK